jgi:iron(II)-dependent oxidoreductase
MTSTAILGQLSGLYEMQLHLLESVPEAEAARQSQPHLPSLNWYYARGVYLELHWLRAIVAGDDDLAQRVSQLLEPGALPLNEQCERLPPRSHLVSWASEIRDEHLRRLSTPGALPATDLTANDRLQWYLLQEQARLYESMLEALNLRRLQADDIGYRCTVPLAAAAPEWQTREISQGHYRIGARDEPRAYDIELPPQAVELSSFRIALTPISNAQYLAFMQAGGYADSALWSDEGRQWLSASQTPHPAYWRRDANGNWYEAALNGNADLPPDEPVAGINRFEAEAFAHWAGQTDSACEGSVVQHEYQWEIAARSGVLQQTGRVWEWCGNAFHTYPEYHPFPGDAAPADTAAGVLRGASLHTQQVLRRPSFRLPIAPYEHHHYAGSRLVFPPKHQWN